jgi:hypothetical protein
MTQRFCLTTQARIWSIKLHSAMNRSRSLNSSPLIPPNSRYQCGGGNCIESVSALLCSSFTILCI